MGQLFFIQISIVLFQDPVDILVVAVVCGPDERAEYRSENVDVLVARDSVVLFVWAGVSSSGFYEWRNRSASATAVRREELKTVIAAVFDDSDGTYGYRRVHAVLARSDIAVGR